MNGKKYTNGTFKLKNHLLKIMQTKKVFKIVNTNFERVK